MIDAAKEAQEAMSQLCKEVDGIIDVGRANFGSRSFDDASQVVAEVLGQKSQGVMDILRGFDKPHDVIMHLAQNEGALKQLAKLSPQRQAIEISRIEGQLSPYGHVATGAEPAWKQPEARRGRASDDNWRTTGGHGLSDAAWSREHDRRMAERNRLRNR
jgi:hypothetical protein